MTDLENLALSVEAYLKQNTTLSANDLAKMCGVSASYITHAINRNWDKIPAGKDKDGNPRYTSFSAEVSKKIALVVNLNKVRIWETSNYVTMFNVLTEAKLNKEHRIISGEKGSGKTFCCTKFVNQYPTETYLITCAGDMGVKDFLIELATVTGASPEGSRMMIRKSICKKLKTTSKALIIIDEAENLKPASYESIKAIYDDVKDYAGIVLVGANNYINTLRKRANAQKSCFPQLYSRFSAEYKELNLLTRDDIKRIATQEGILDKVQINKLCDMCTDYRELDRMIKRMLNDKHLIITN